MTDREKIRAEVLRLKDAVGIGLDAYDMGMENGVFETCEKILQFIDSLPEEPASKDLEEAAKQCAERRSYLSLRKGELVEAYNLSAKESFIEGANWQKNQSINKACEWLKAQEEMIGISFQEDFIERFRKAMED